MTTNWIVKLTHGKSELDLNSGRYQPTLNFVPPAVASVPLIASGTSANRFLGGTKVSERFNDRGFHLELYGRGSSDVEVARAGSDLANFLSLAGGNTPLYLEVKTNSDVPYDPKWGNYGVAKKFEIVHANPPQVAPDIALGVRRSKRAIFSSSLRVKPFALGKSQRLASATGGVLEDTIGWKDGLSRGTIIPEATTNKFLNPVLQHGTWDNGYTATTVVATENTDSRFVLFGNNSAKLVAPAQGNFSETINVGNTNLHCLSCYVKLPDGSPVVAQTHVQLWYNGNRTTTSTAVGDNGWYRLTVLVNGLNSPVLTGVMVNTGYTVYCTGFQIEEKSYVTPLAHGNLLGCAWTGTAHASTSTRTAGRVRVAEADSVNIGEGTWRVAWKADLPSTDIPTSDAAVWLNWDCTENAYLAYIEASTATQFTDGTNTASASDSWSAGDKITWHATWNPTDGLVLYRNGASFATDATFTPATSNTYLYIGSNSSASEHVGGTFSEAATYDRAMTAAEVLADYTNLSQLTADNQRVGSIPYLWTKDGDDVIDNCNDSTRDNYFVARGIPGSAVADTMLDFTHSTSEKDNFLSLLSYPGEFQDPVDYLIADQGGTGSDPAYCGQEYATPTYSTSPTEYYTPHLTKAQIESVSGKQFYILNRLSDTGSNLTMYPMMVHGSGIVGDVKALSLGGIDLVRSSPLVVPSLDRVFVTPNTIIDESDTSLRFGVRLVRTVGSAGSVVQDYFHVMMEPAIKYEVGNLRFVYRDKTLAAVDSTTGAFESLRDITGTPINFSPEQNNLLFNFSGVDGGGNGDGTTTITLTFNRVDVIPRYQML